ncbi:S-layer homology domain-containing protein [Paenibacillus rhizolycopersici]|uniref:S-layer homology domain-containing protein n=1 Tax=Paenibacillus rhizolycopersici TaxID=2780073 RepID=UPI003D2C5357
MSNTSYSFKENSHVIVNQGGEKKVMKKILSVALSTAMAFSMFASVAFGADAKLTPEQQFNALKDAGIVSGFPDGLSHLEKTLTRAELAKIIVNSLSLEPVDATSYNDANYANHWGRTYIEAATQAGILNGKDAAKKLFDPNGAVTVQELAKVLVTALKLEVPADANNTASAWAKGYVAAAVNAGYLADGINYQAQATRSQAVVAAYAIYEAAQFKVTKAEAIDATHVKLTLSSGEVVDVTLEKALEPNKATELEYTTKDGKVLKYTVTYVVTTATKVEKVAATNLKEAVVTFDGKVDKETAEEVANYSFKSGKAVKSAVLSDDEKSVTLTLNSQFTNNKVEYLSVSNVKAGDATISAKEVQFTVSDNELPEVKEVKSLGTKAIKVTFTEPVTGLVQGNFELDGSAYYGDIKVLSTRSYVLTPYSGALSVGEHKLVVKNATDFAGFVGLTSSHNVTVVEDTTAPTVSEASATLESVTLTFSEEVDRDTFDEADVYWQSSGSKKEANRVEYVADNKYKFYFEDADNALPTGPVTIHVQDVTDFSGNVIASGTTVVVTPEIDQTRPEVTKVEAIDKNTIEVTFSKVLDDEEAEDEDNYTVTDKDGNVLTVSKAELIADDNGALKIVKLTTYKDLTVGNNKLTIKNVQDNTRLKNTMLDYSGTVVLGDTEGAKIDGNYLVNTADGKIVLTFNEKMDVDTLTSYSNYYVNYTDGSRKTLTGSIADLSVLNAGTAVVITFAENVDLSEIASIVVLGLKDANGNLLDEFMSGSGSNVIAFVDKGLEVKSAKLVDKKTVEVEFNSTISAASRTAFIFDSTATTATYNVTNVKFDGTNKVKLTWDTEYTDTVGLELAVDGTLTTLAGKLAIDTTGTPVAVADAVAPEIKGDLVVAGNTITATFTEDLAPVTDESRLVSDFVITRKWDGTKLKTSEYDVAVVGNTIVITLNDTTTYNSAYTVQFKGSDLITDDIAPADVNKAKAFTKTSGVVASH